MFVSNYFIPSREAASLKAPSDDDEASDPMK